MTSDPKQGKRIVDPDALRRARARGPLECAACGGPPSNVHHVLQKSAPHFGDDVIENLLLLCGTGTMLCHGAWHGSPYTAFHLDPEGQEVEERRNREWVAARIGRFIIEWRPDTLVYVVKKLGLEPALVFLSDEYRIPESTARRIWAHELVA